MQWLPLPEPPPGDIVLYVSLQVAHMYHVRAYANMHDGKQAVPSRQRSALAAEAGRSSCDRIPRRTFLWLHPVLRAVLTFRDASLKALLALAQHALWQRSSHRLVPLQMQRRVSNRQGPYVVSQSMPCVKAACTSYILCKHFVSMPSLAASRGTANTYGCQ